jgi:hypothetical protein
MPSPKSANLRHLDYEWITGNPEVEPRQQFLAARRLPHLRRLAPTRASEVLLILAKHTRNKLANFHAWWCADGVRILTGEVDPVRVLERGHLIRMILW